MKLYTIGHSAHKIDKFLSLLNLHEIQTVVDIRSVPYSRFHPQFRKSAFENTLNDIDIAYLFLGQKLGGRPEDPSCYPEGALPPKGTRPWPRPNYDAMMTKDWFQHSVHDLIEIAQNKVTVILCSEENPENCHRHGLVAKYLDQNHPEIQVIHIRGDGSTLTAKQLETQIGRQLHLFEKGNSV
jgi:uncharacterized protein (DUF488 family)